MSFRIEKRPETLLLVTLIAAVVTLTAQNVTLQNHNRRLSSEIEALSNAEGPPIGSRISVLHGQSPVHKDLTLPTSAGGRKTLLLVLSPTCPYCKVNLPTWKEILQSSTHSNVIYVDISGNVPQSYLRASGLPDQFPLIELNPEERLLYDFRATPTTVVLDSTGAVTGKWTGVMTPKQTSDLIDKLNGV